MGSNRPTLISSFSSNSVFVIGKSLNVFSILELLFKTFVVDWVV